MKEFVTAVEEIENEDNEFFVTEEDGKTLVRDENGDPIPLGSVIPFKMDGRILYARQPNDGQLAFMLAALGRGQSSDQRFAAILNIMFATLRPEDADYLEGRMLSAGRDRLPVQKIEEVFEHLTEEWFARPTQSPSDSASSPPSDGQN